MPDSCEKHVIYIFKYAFHIVWNSHFHKQVIFDRIVHRTLPRAIVIDLFNNLKGTDMAVLICLNKTHIHAAPHTHTHTDTQTSRLTNIKQFRYDAVPISQHGYTPSLCTLCISVRHVGECTAYIHDIITDSKYRYSSIRTSLQQPYDVIALPLSIS